MHVLIVGAGVGGLCLAQSLRKQNISFEVFERDTNADARFQGWAIAMHSYVSASHITQFNGWNVNPSNTQKHLVL